jgi:hypothetical protein
VDWEARRYQYALQDGLRIDTMTFLRCDMKSKSSGFPPPTFLATFCSTTSRLDLMVPRVILDIR